MALTPNQKLLLIGGGGIAAVAAVLLLSGTASAAPAPSAPSTGGGGGSTGPTLSPASAQGQAAIALASAIQTAGGYCGTQSALVSAYQTAAGQGGANIGTVDGYPGADTITQLRTDLNNMGSNSAGATYASQYPLVFSIATYPWLAAGSTNGGWVSGNVPAAFADGSGAAWTAGTGCPGT